MPESPIAIQLESVAKEYRIYRRPQDRLWQLLFGGERYHSVPALSGIDLTVKRGETVGVIGRNGAGKSTLLKLVAGTSLPTAGNVRIRGRVAALLELGTGFNPDFSGRDNVYLNAGLHGLTREQVDERFERIASFAGIGDFMEEPVRTYSSGMKVRLAFAVIANIDADILIIDEALAVGDVVFVQKCMRFLRAFRERGTLFFVSHSTVAVTNLCDRAIYLAGGRIMAQGDAKSVCEQYLSDVQMSEEKDSAAVSVDEVECPEVRRMPVTRVGRDPRQDLLSISRLRNDLEAFDFDPATERHGDGRGRIIDAYFTDPEGRPLHWIVGGERVRLDIHICPRIALNQPIVGFLVKDRLGQFVFGDNTYLISVDEPTRMIAGHVYRARFTFRMPFLPPGDYTVDLAFAEGTQADHRVLDWRRDALVFVSHQSSIHRGLVGIPMESIEVSEIDPASSA